MAIEPLYSLDVACELIPMTRDALLHTLSRYPEKFDEPRYIDNVRMLSEHECLTLRELVIRRGPGRGFLNRNRSVGIFGLKDRRRYTSAKNSPIYRPRHRTTLLNVQIIDTNAR